MSEHEGGSGAPDIAIIGMVGRFPGAPDLESFWRNLREGKSSIRRIEPAELDQLGVDPELRRDPSFVPFAAPLEGMEQFDAAFFGYSPREAELLDPQQRVFLECAWEALEDAGYDPESGKGRVGVFAGATASTYLLVNLASRPELAAGAAGFQLFVGNTADSLATRVSYKLNLRGPSFAVSSACSTSLLAVHLACQSLLNEECDLALAGGASINLAQRGGYYYAEGSILSPDGTCSPFDAAARGTVFGAGAGIVVLKRLSDALADGDCIRAVIRGSAISNDGKLKVGFTAPGIQGQSTAIAEALALSGLRADELSYIEAHGTGTSLGDPIEVEALSKAFQATTSRKGFCAIGTVKGNIGHLDVAAGVAGLIKTVLALENEEIPPSPGFKEPNPQIDFANSPVYVNRVLSPWRSGRTPRRAGVSSFGMGGTNVHAVLEEAPRRGPRRKSDRPQLLVLSAKTPQALDAATARLGEHLERHPELELMDVAHTLQAGRHAFRYRRSAVAGDPAEAVLKLKARQPPPSSAPEDADPAVAFLFPGQGAQRPGMGADLYRTQPVFRQHLDECAELLKPHLGFDLRELLLVEPGRFAEVAPRLGQTELAQPALFAVEYSLAETWMAWGVRPKAMMGHSLGEYVAATLAGVFSLPDALGIIAARGRLMQGTARGSMLAVGLSAEDIPEAVLRSGVSLAAVNERNQCVLSGPAERVQAAIPLIAERGVPFKQLDVSCSPHSTTMDPILGELREVISRVRRSAPRLPFVSNATGTWIRPEEATDPDYWARHLRQAVRFAEGLAALRRPAEHVLLEVGPGQPLNGMSRRSGAKVVASSMPSGRGGLTETQALLASLGQLWQAGVAPDWSAVHGEEDLRRTPLPTYPFERRRYWISPRRRDGSLVSSTADDAPAADQVFHPRPALEQECIAPRTDLEREVAGLWQRLLGLEQVGVEDSFFAVGGDSLLATQLASQLRSKFGVEVQLRRLLEQPTVAATASLLSSLLGQPAAEPWIIPRLPREPGTNRFPLSFAQQRLWFLDQLEPGKASYNMPGAVRLEGGLDVAALRRSLDELVRRHESLRTTFASEAGASVQVVAPELRVELPVVELPEGVRDGERWIQDELEREAARPFDLGRGPLLRAKLLRLSAGEHVLLVTMHHIVSDGWSMTVVVREVAALYAAFHEGNPSPLPELPVQYPDFSVWQRKWLSGERLEDQLSYWKERLSGLATLELPIDEMRPAVQTYGGARHEFDLPAALTARLKKLGQQQDATLFMTLLAGLKALLYRLAGQGDLSIGTPIANRGRAELEGLIGFFVNTLVMRTEVDGKQPFSELLGKVRATALGAYAHQDLPFEQLVEAVQPARDLSRSPLFQVMFVLQNAPAQELKLSGLALEAMEVDPGTAKFDLTLVASEAAEGKLRCWFEYNTDLFEAATLARWAGHYRRLLEAAVEAPDALVSELEILSDAEQRQLLAEWNDTAAEYPQGACMHSLFEVQAKRTPDAVAVVSGGSRLTYAELDAKANQLAHHLRSLGVGPEVRVGICVERSPELLVGLLGILKAGGAYVPLDPSYPAERVAFMLADSRAPVLLSQRSLRPRLPETSARVVLLDAEAEAISRLPATPVPSGASPDNLGYLIYTSGSTGRPKGVAIAHRSAVALVAWAHGAYSESELRTVLASTSICFDLSIFELYVPLARGGTVVLARDAMQLVGGGFGGLTLINTVPSAMAELLRNGAVPASVRVINLAGEPLKPALVQEIYRRTPVRRVCDLYGPSEDTTYSTGTERQPDGPATIGRSIANKRLYVLDRALNPVPVGVPGELYMTGVGLARGYLDRPELTAERFIPDPFSAEPGARMYRTGDLGRWRPGGKVEFLGRIDHQVKVRGFRIELGEIEAALSTQPGVDACVVVARDGRGGDKELVAYVGTKAGSADAEQLRRALRQRLPEYMVPSVFVLLEALPQTPNGKVDRKALPAPEASRAALGAGTYVGPRSPAEEMLAGFFCEVLGLPAVGIHDNFFELGGHSLKAMQLVSRVREAMGVELPLRGLFDAPSVAGLAARLAAEEPEADGPVLRKVPRGEALPLSFAQQRLWFLEQLEPGGSAYNLPAAVRLRGALDVEALRAALNEVVRRHEALRTTFAAVHGRGVQVVAETLALELPVLERQEGMVHPERRDRGAIPESKGADLWLREQTRREAEQPFDLRRGPLLRTKLLRLGAKEHVLLVTMHHIVSDGWSMGVLVREVAALYGAFQRGEASPLPELSIQYPDFSAWQREWLSGPRLEDQLSYWRERLSGLAALELPADKVRPAVQTSHGAQHEFELPAPLMARLKELSRKQGATLFMTLLAGLKALLYRLAGQGDLSIGTPTANRGRAELEGLIGFFVNTLVMRTEVDGRQSFSELLGKVRATALGAWAHQDLPFEQLVEAVQPARDLSRTPLFQVMFALQNAPMGELALPGLALELMPFEAQTAKFDLTLMATEADGKLRCAFEYNTDLFEASTLERWAGHYQRLLESAAESPSTRICELELLPEPERRRLLVEWNDTGAAQEPRTVVELFEEEAAARPDAVALLFEDVRLTYAELNARANRLAHALRQQGVGLETRVGVAVERSLEMVVAVLGILKAGGAYVPLDPGYPEERLAFMRKKAGVSIVVRDLRGCAGQPASNLPSQCGPENLAYVMFTSGSTGQPKGVGVVHRAIARLVRGNVYARLTPEETLLQAGPLGFDASTFELWGALLNGGRLALLPPGAPTLDGLERAIQKHGVTTLFLTAALFHYAVGERPGLLSPLRQLLTGGDAISPASVERARRALPHCALIMGYGPTETTTFASYHPARGAESGAAMPIGRPLANTRLYLLDGELRPVPVGVAGELYIGGDGLARGYLGQPELTAERFVPDAFSGVPGSRLYRTGDRVRSRADGCIEFLGRTDAQVKIRGYRIEPGEVEAALRECPGVSDAAVVVRQQASEKQLIAYYAGAAGVGELRAALKQRLPEYMVPSAFVGMEALPLTPNGKVDRRALPAPEASRAALGAGAYAGPRSPAEEMLAGFFAEVLGLPAVGIHDDFFGLGGHSLKATQLVSRVREAFGVEVPLRAVFERPTVAGLAQALEGNDGEVDGPELRAGSRPAEVPLSFAQQRLWFLEQLDPGGSSYNIPVAVRLAGALDVEALRAALDEVVRRHEALRTSFQKSAAGVVQVVAPGLRLDLPVFDHPERRDRGASPESKVHPERRDRGASPESKGVADSWVREQAREEARRGFDLSRGPLLRAKLLRLGAEEHVLLATMHHIVSDGWSMGVLVREVAALYPAFHRGEASPLPELPVQYPDFSVWQRQWLSGPRLDAQRSYWKERLSGVATLELPADKARPPVQTFNGARHEFEVPAELAGRLKALSREQGATLFITLLAGFKALLHRLAGQGDLSVGTPIANRSRAELEGLIGFFVNTLVLRTEVDGRQSFSELLGKVRGTALGAYAHQDLPFEQLVEAVQPARDLSRSPLFQVMFAFQNAPAQQLELPGLALEPWEVDGGTAKFDLTLSATEAADGKLRCSFEYNTDLFEAATLARWAGHYRRLLEAAVDAPGAPVSELELLSEPERRQLLVEWNDTAAEYPEDACIHSLFEAQARRTPSAVAAVSGDSRLTYSELDAKANRLAHHLRSLGVGPEVRVGICAERSLELVAGLLGILKAGGAYVPLDPSYPAERVAFMLADSRAPVLLSQRSLQARLPETSARIVLLDAGAEAISRLPATPVSSGVVPDNLGYLIYTSGSTGTPKGVAIAHRSAVALVAWAHGAYSEAELRTVLASTSICFDLSIFELFAPLARGGTVVLAQDAMQLLGGGFGGLTLINTVPSAMAELLRNGAVPESVRVINLAGEPLKPALVQEIFRRTPVRRVCDLYGPSEDTTYSTGAERQPDGPATIGRSLANKRLYLLDPALHPVPMGVPGELYVTGAGLARGYLDRPELTAERFVPDPFSAEAGARMYRTGDLGRWRPEGRVEFLGRIDHQVKVRGFRIELGEVEAALAAQRGVDACVVVAREDGPGEKRLVAYVGAQGGGVGAEELRSALRRRLPEYMVPSVFVVLEALPLTPNGKVDRKALPAPEASRAALGAGAYVAPRSPAEERVAGLFGEVLGLPAVGIHDDFFQLGGHSLLLITLLMKLRERIGMELSVRAFLESPTAAGVAAHAQAVAGAGAEPARALPACLLPLCRGEGSPLFLIHPAGGDALCFAPLAQHLPGRPVFGIQAPGLAGEQAPLESLEELAAHDVRAIRTVQAHGPYFIGGWSLGAHVAVEVARQLRALGEEVPLCALIDADPAAGREARRNIPGEAFGDHSLWLGFIAEYIDQLGGEKIPMAADGLKGLSPDAQVEAFAGRLRGLSLPQARLGAEQLRHVLAVFKANMRALMNHVPRKYDGPLTLIEAERSTLDKQLARSGWSERTSGAVEALAVPGDHHTALSPANAPALARVLSTLLERDGQEAA